MESLCKLLLQLVIITSTKMNICVYHLLKLEAEHDVVIVGEDESPVDRLEIALKCLPQYDPSLSFHTDPSSSFRYWKIRDYAFAYRSKLTAPSVVSHFTLFIFSSFTIFILAQTKNLVSDC